METTPFNNLYVRPTEHWEKFIDKVDNIVPTLHYEERVRGRSNMTIEEARHSARKGIQMWKVKKCIHKSRYGGTLYMSIDNWIHIMYKDWNKIILVTYFKTERQMMREQDQEINTMKREFRWQIKWNIKYIDNQKLSINT